MESRQREERLYRAAALARELSDEIVREVVEEEADVAAK